MPSLYKAAAIVGVGESDVLGRSVPNQSTMQIQVEVAKKALADAGLSIKDVDGVLCPGPLFNYPIVFAENMGISPVRWSSQHNLGGASAVASVLDAAAAIQAGLCHTVLVVNGNAGGLSGGSGGGGSATRNSRDAAVQRLAELGNPEFEIPFGPLLISHYAMAAQRHMHQYGTTGEQLAEIAVAFRHHACLTEKAQMKGAGEITVEDVLNSRWISTPLHMLDCCVISQGAAAVVVTSPERARNSRKRPAWILGGGQGHINEYFMTAPDITSHGLRVAAENAWAMSGLTPKDVDFLEIYDSFTITILIDLEDMGFCQKGEGGAFVEDGRLRLDGALPANTHGGLLSYCHIGNIMHIVEAVRQMRGECGKRQVKKNDVCAVSGSGGFMSTKSMMVLGKE